MVVIAGCEAHVCLLQTALELLEEEFDVWVVTDACGSRTERNRDAAFDRLAGAGAELVTTEMVAFEWLRSCEHPPSRICWHWSSRGIRRGPLSASPSGARRGAFFRGLRGMRRSAQQRTSLVSVNIGRPALQLLSNPAVACLAQGRQHPGEDHCGFGGRSASQACR